LTPALSVRGLTKIYRTYQKESGLFGALKGLGHRRYTETAAARDVTFEVPEGELVGFLGPNGAGKTTVLKMLSGLLHPTRGEASVLGFTPWRRQNEFKRQFALVLGQKNQLWWDLPAAESLELNRVIYGLERRDAQRTIDELTALLDVREKLDTMVRELSLGERMKMELIAALLHQPKVLFLDEPTIGLDVVSQKKVREFLRDIEELCRRVIIIDRGQVFFDGELHDIIERLATHKIMTLTSRRGLKSCELSRFGKVLEKSDDQVRIKIPRAKIVAASRELISELEVEDFTVEDVPIEDIIREVFAEQRREREARAAAEGTATHGSS
jgi:ABC-2 type transport system ATP-binding protein